MNIQKISQQIPEEKKTEEVIFLLGIIETLCKEVESLKLENSKLKGSKGRPKIPPSNLEGDKAKKNNGNNKKRKKSKKKTKKLKIHRTEIIEPENIPEGSKFKGYQDYVLQELLLESCNIKYRLARWESPNGEYLIGELPDEVEGHYGKTLICFVLYQYYHGHVTQALIQEQLEDLGNYTPLGLGLEKNGIFLRCSITSM